MACESGEVVVDLGSKFQIKLLLKLKREGKWRTKKRLDKGYLDGGGAKEGRAPSSMVEIWKGFANKSFLAKSSFEERGLWGCTTCYLLIYLINLYKFMTYGASAYTLTSYIWHNMFQCLHIIYLYYSCIQVFQASYVCDRTMKRKDLRFVWLKFKRIGVHMCE